MIDIQLDERCIFTFGAKDKCIGIWRHRDGPLTGPVEGPLGFITFANKWQAKHFQEIMYLLIHNMVEDE